ncbi:MULTISPECIES: DNA-protecting protein DprA [Lonsdalea]|uniref:DNA processing protein DprA n=3 Tax=Lonsdalea TaxID=1082702 RepID=A0ACD1J8L9_9GAMM|nr:MULTISPECIES: DNA-protecting protein DprA [Lonsdalea]OSM93941.1 DNA processing protein DprA [Lonsdalea populi]OSM94348.1 DNA processing protein DprA [Lonsdalea populi]QPQ24545.1 DNA-protecting protein DprA [Lonsdalea populi]RAT10934.1 DNA processing protein DprA [Lonsdalea quercina]RAT12915.1 DNA processing protein DprA [Lonsdalea quercina]
MTDTEVWLRLASVSRLGARKIAQLVSQIKEACGFSSAFLQGLGLSESQTQQFYSYEHAKVEAVSRWLEHPSHSLVFFGTMEYPFLLGNISSPPPVLYVIGDTKLLGSPQIAMVGSRNHSAYGELWGKFFAQEFSLSQLTITSGLAVGIDGIAHQAALDTGGKTIAVLGSGLNHLYPRRHRPLADRIVEQGGALVSEFALDTRPLPVNFPRRNRIISGLSQGVLVVEASRRSGSLVTARYALEQNREVFALPGAIGNAMTEGTHWLIQQGAYLVTHPKDIIEQLGSDLHWLTDFPDTDKEIICSQESEVELPFADVLANVGDEVTPVDVVAERAGQPVPEVVSKLLDLELAGWIAAVPGGYVRLRRACHVRRTHVLV